MTAIIDTLVNKVNLNADLFISLLNSLLIHCVAKVIFDLLIQKLIDISDDDCDIKIIFIFLFDKQVNNLEDIPIFPCKEEPCICNKATCLIQEIAEIIFFLLTFVDTFVPGWVGL